MEKNSNALQGILFELQLRSYLGLILLDVEENIYFFRTGKKKNLEVYDNTPKNKNLKKRFLFKATWKKNNSLPNTHTICQLEE